MALRVAINATPLLSPLTGIGNYIAQLGAALDAIGDVDAYSFYGYRWRHEAPSPRAQGVGRAGARRARDLIKPFVPFARELRRAMQQALFAGGLRRNAIELYHEPNYVPIAYDVPVVVTIHDLSWSRFPETHPADRVRWLASRMPSVVERAAAILVDSEFVRQEVLTTLSADPGRVHVVHLGVSSQFRPRTESQTTGTLRSFDLIHGQYLLTVGTIEPRKNVSHVLAAYTRLPEAMRNRYPLAVAGASGWRAADLKKDLRKMAAQGRIRFLGAVPDADLQNLYAGAAAFIFASKYEGFGLPPLEAMACGVPVLVSDRASLPEVTGDAAWMLDPERPEDTAGKIEALLDDDAARAELARRGRERAARFTWEASARATREVYRAVR